MQVEAARKPTLVDPCVYISGRYPRIYRPVSLISIYMLAYPDSTTTLQLCRTSLLHTRYPGRENHTGPQDSQLQRTLQFVDNVFKQT